MYLTRSGIKFKVNLFIQSSGEAAQRPLIPSDDGELFIVVFCILKSSPSLALNALEAPLDALHWVRHLSPTQEKCEEKIPNLSEGTVLESF
jgi:hypothetical protein